MRTLVIVVVLAIAAMPAASWAQDAPSLDRDARAKELYANGQRLYEEGHYEQAIVAWQEAWRLSGRPALLYNVSNANERLGRLQEAVDNLNLYRAYASGEEATTLDRRLAVLERRIAEQRAPAGSPAEVAPAPIVAAAAQALPEPPSLRGRRLRPAIAVTGAGAALVFGTVAAVTYASSRASIAEGDREQYQRLIPFNNVAVGLAGAGLLVTGIGLVPVWTNSGPTLVGSVRF